MATLGEVADWGSGGTPSRSVASYFGEGIPWLSIADLNDGPVSSAKESLTAAGVANSAAKVVPSGTLFIAMYGSIGKLGIATREFVTSQAIAFAKPKSGMVDTRYLFHYLLAQRPRLRARGRGGTQMNISQGDLKAWPIPLPSIEEQRRIADILDTADAIRSKHKAVLARLDSLTRAHFVATFGDPRSWPDRWPMGRIRDHARSVSYGTSAKAGSTGEWPVLRMGNITDDGRLDLTDLKYLDLSAKERAKYTLQRGDLLFNRTNSVEKVGKSAVVRTDESLAYAGYLVRVRFDGPDVAEFVAAYLNSDFGRGIRRRLAKAAVNQANINATEMQDIPIAVPDGVTLARFARGLDAIDAQRAAVQRALAADDELFASLQSRAFSGKL